MEKAEVKVKSITGIKKAILTHTNVWLTIDGQTWVYVELRPPHSIWINYGYDDKEEKDLAAGLTQIYNFLSFKSSTDQL